MPKKGYKQTLDHIRKSSQAREGIKFTKEHREKLRKAKIGNQNAKKVKK